MSHEPNLEPNPPAHMTPEEFRRLGHRAVDFIAEYWGKVGTMPVLCPLAPGETAAKLPEHPPERAENWDSIFGDLDRVVVPGLTHWQSPNFFAYFPANGSFPAIICAGPDLHRTRRARDALWATSPACTEIETACWTGSSRCSGCRRRFCIENRAGAG